MTQTFNCPSCQAALDLPEPVPLTVKCSYCNATVVVPASLRTSNATTNQLPEDEAQDKIAALRQISELVQKGQKLEAIRLFRETFDTSLNQAKEVIELIEQGVQVTPLTAEIRRTVTPTITITSTSTDYHPVYNTSPSKTAGNGCAISWGLLLLLLFGLGVIVWFSWGSLATTFRNIGINGPTQLLPVGDGAADLAFTIDDYGEEDDFSIGFLFGNQPDTQWESEKLAGNGYSSQLLANDSQIFVSLETNFYALNRADGTQQWQTTLTDRLPYSCWDCFLTFEDSLVVLTYDDRLHGINRQTGEILWQQDADVDRLLPLGEWVGLMREQEDAGTGLEILNPTTGELVRRLEPRCTDSYGSDDPYPTDWFEMDAGTNSIYFLFDYPELCFQRWNFITGEQLLDVKVNSSSFSPSYNGTLATPDSFYFSQYNQIMALNKQDGTVRFVLEEEAYDFSFLEANAGILLIRAINNRGTTREELWAVHPQTGNLLWKYIPPADEMLVSGETEVIYEDDKGMWQAHLTNRGVVLLQAQHNPPRLTFDIFDLTTGSSSGQKTLNLSVDKESSYWFMPIGWDKNLVWLNINLNELWLVDPFTAEQQRRYP